jgi:hypothetical protein
VLGQIIEPRVRLKCKYVKEKRFARGVSYFALKILHVFTNFEGKQTCIKQYFIVIILTAVPLHHAPTENRLSLRVWPLVFGGDQPKRNSRLYDEY